ncbi:MAG: response regulator [Candidatus Omnitrophota bacterium]
MAKRILVVDDDKLVLMTLKRLLRMEGYNVTTALSGAAALRHIDEEDFDLNIVDVKMPQMNGIETVKEIRKHLTEKKKNPIPEVFITAYAKEEIYKEALLLDAAGYMQKPFDLKALLDITERIIGKEKE